jgi:hypothetical protein
MATRAKTVDWGGMSVIVDEIRLADKPGEYGTATTLTSAEAAVLDGVTAGTVTASKAVIVDSNKDVSGFRKVTTTGPVGTGATGAGLLTLQTAELTVASATADQLGRIDFQAPSESSGTDAILVAASIWAEAAADFTATANETDLVVALGVSEAAAEKYRITRTGGVQGGAPVVIADGAAYAVLTKNSGLLHAVPDVTANITVTLPAADAGLSYEFMYTGVAADAENHIFVPTAGFFIGNVTFMDAQADATTVVYSDGNSNDVFTIVTPGAYSIKFVCDGTNWYVTGNVTGATVCTMAD